jgi:cytochrome P450 PksS
MGLFARLTGRERTAGDAGPDIASPAHKADPFPFYARLRAESPVHRVTLRGGMSAWLVTRYDDVVAVLRDERFAKDRLTALTPDQLRKQPWVPPMFRPLARNMLDLDPPDHDRLRALVQKAFTPRLVEGLRPRVQALADGLLDGLRGRPHFDLIRDYALPIPTTVMPRCSACRRPTGTGSSGGRRRSWRPTLPAWGCCW